jgi:hypothetical protein
MLVAMSGTQVLVEAKVTVAKAERQGLLDAVAAVPTHDARIDVSETRARVDVRAFFSVDAEARADRIVEACRAAAARGATGAGVLFVLVDYQRESGSAFVLEKGACVVEPMSEKEARAKHAKLDRLLEQATIAETTSTSDPALLAAAKEACAALEAFSKDDLAAAFERIKATTITTAAFGVSKKQEKKLPRLEGTWFWREALPIRLYAELAPEAAEPMTTALLATANLVSDERFMLLEALSRSPSDDALAIVAKAFADTDTLVANAAGRALAYSPHPRATDHLVEGARAWLAATKPETLPYQLDMAAAAVLISLRLRNDEATRALLYEVWQTLFDTRTRIPAGAYATPIMAAQLYLEAIGASGLALPGAGAPLEAWAEVIAKARA